MVNDAFCKDGLNLVAKGMNMNEVAGVNGPNSSSRDLIHVSSRWKVTVHAMELTSGLVPVMDQVLELGCEVAGGTLVIGNCGWPTMVGSE